MILIYSIFNSKRFCCFIDFILLVITNNMINYIKKFYRIYHEIKGRVDEGGGGGGLEWSGGKNFP